MGMTMITIIATGIPILMRIPTAATAIIIITIITGMARRIMITTTRMTMTILTTTITIMSTIILTLMIMTTRPRVRRSIMAVALPACTSPA